jgi:hypothetical protein
MIGRAVVARALTSILAVMFVLSFGAGRASAAGWSSTSLTSDSVSARDPQIDTGPDGTTLAAWEEQSGGTYLGIHATVRPPGGSFSTGQTVTAVGGNPVVSVNPQGGGLVAWARRYNGGKSGRVQASVLSGGSFSAPINLTPKQPGFITGNHQIDTGANGTTALVWEYNDSGFWRVQARIRFPDGSLGPVQTLSRSGRFAYDPQVAVGPTGRAFVSWTLNANATGPANYRVQVSVRPPGESFHAPIFLSDASQYRTAPTSIDVGSDGTAVVAWVHTSLTDFSWSVQARVRPPGAGTSFGSAQTLYGADAGYSGNIADVAVGPTGGAVAVWSNGVVYASVLPPGGHFHAPVQVSAAGAVGPLVDTGEDRTTVVAWTQDDGSNSRQAASVKPPGGGFGTPELLSESGFEAGQGSAVAVAPDGSADVIWLDSDASSLIVEDASWTP